MNEVMQHILLLSAAGSALALVLLCIKPLTKRLFSPKWQYYVWLTVLIVMVLPVKLSLPAEPVQITPAENTSAQTQQITPVQTQQEPAQPAALEEIAQRPALRIPDIPNAIVRISGFLWLAAAALLLGYRIAKYMMFLRTIKKYSVPECSLENIPKRLTVRKTELLDAPLIVGLIKPVLYLPQTEIKEEKLDYILLHELTHYRRHDLLYKWFAMLVSSIHWFNPFVYIVSRQIDEECEVSCDYAVCKTLTEPQKKDYMAMILDFVQTSIRKKRPLTTQMASSKKILKRRFLMMKTKKATSKFVSVLLVVLALAMLSTTVFASGVLSGLTEDNYTVEITNNGEVIELVNKPFIENGEVYVPLRELFEKVGVMEHPDSKIEWNNGKIELTVAYYDNSTYATQAHEQPIRGQEIDSVSFIYDYALEIGNPSLADTNIMMLNAEGQGIPNEQAMSNAPVLRSGNTYIPYSYINYLLKNKNWMIGYIVRDKNREIIDISSNALRINTTIIDGNNEVVFKSEDLKEPEKTITGFFNAFADSEFTLMKNYCTEECRSGFFGDGYCFGMTKAELTDLSIDPLEYAKSSNDFNAFVTVNMRPHEQSVFDSNDTSTSFYVILQRQSDGRYLIDEFATGL